MDPTEPLDDVRVPASVQAAIGPDATPTPVWRNDLGGLTFEVTDPSGRTFLKWAPAGCGLDLDVERERLAWAGRFTAVPTVLAHGQDQEGSWLRSRALPGASAVRPPWLARPQAAATAIGRGLRHLHDVLPVPDCPFSWDAAGRAQRARERGHLDPAQWHRDHAGLTLRQALDRLADVPPVDRLVVCHGDPCAPNTLIGADGRCTGHVDLGALGLADRWADLAVATWSLDWNYGPGWGPTLLRAYGVDPDPARTAYYRLLWDLSP